MIGNWVFDESDELAIKLLEDKMPESFFDFHAHIYRKDFIPSGSSGVFNESPGDVTPDIWRQRVGKLVGPRRLSGALFLAFPMVPPDSIGRVNSWTIEAAEKEPSSRALVIVAPGMSPGEVEIFLDHDSFAGFKPYHVHASSKPTFEAEPGSFLPEWAWELAGNHGLLITLHLVRAGAMADEQNIRYMREHCEKYPGARLVLAHAGRSFHGPNARRGARALVGLPNIFFDTSGVCESEPIEALLEFFGPRRILWGTDFPVSEQRGRCVTMGDGFAWVTEDIVGERLPGPPFRMWPVGLESMRALLLAADKTGLGKEALAEICAHNARRLLGMAG